MRSYDRGMRVKASIVITESGGDTVPDFEAKSLGIPGYVHAEVGDFGTVEYVDADGVPTVRFDRKGTATIVGDNEIEVVPV